MDISTLYQIFLKNPVICTDSRKLTPECIFFALQGENFDGNLYAKAALESGAAFAVIDRPELKLNDRYICVPNVLNSLQELATMHRNQMNAKVIALTGSNGKTTTKELAKAVLSRKYQVHATTGNLNNHIGVPLTLLAANRTDEIMIVEMGANHQGEIAHLCQIARPDFVMITNVGKAHMEGFGGVEGIKKGKSEMYRYAASGHKTIFCNSDDEVLLGLLPDHAQMVYYSSKQLIQEIQTEPTLTFRYKDETIYSNLFGHYNIHNLSFALALGSYFDIPPSDIKIAIESYYPDNNRSQLIHHGNNTIIKDAYNANPTSMKLSIESFVAMDKTTKIVILGDMLELGEYSFEEHTKIIELVQSLNIQHSIYIGKQFYEAGHKKSGNFFLNIEDAKAFVKSCKFDNVHILLKGSRGIAVEKIFET